MEIVYFVLGVITVLSIGAIVIAINGKIKSDKTDKSVTDSIKDFKIEVEGIYRQMDSRFDKITSKINKIS